MRVLYQRHDHEGQGAFGSEATADRARGAAGAGRPSLPLRDAQPDRRRDPAGRQTNRRQEAVGQADGEALTMNAPILTRRSFGKAVGGLVVAFSLDPAEILAQGAGKPAPLPGSLNTNRSLRAWVRIGGDGN